MKLVYFAWLRERVGFGQEEIDLPQEVSTVSELLNWLRSRGENFEEALKHPEVIRVAIDQVHENDLDKNITSAKEIALFPPMTGG